MLYEVITEFRYVTSPIESYRVSRDGEAFMSRREEPPTRIEVRNNFV